MSISLNSDWDVYFIMGKLYRVLIPLFAVVFGIIWMILASSIGAPGFFLLFGLLFVGIAIFILLRVLFFK